MAWVDADRAPVATTRHGANQENKYYVATQFQLMWWKFKKHKLALIGAAVLGVFLLISLTAEFLAPNTPYTRDQDYLFGPPQVLRIVDAQGQVHLPFIYGSRANRNPVTFRITHEQD